MCESWEWRGELTEAAAALALVETRPWTESCHLNETEAGSAGSTPKRHFRVRRQESVDEADIGGGEVMQGPDTARRSRGGGGASPGAGPRGNSEKYQHDGEGITIKGRWWARWRQRAR